MIERFIAKVPVRGMADGDGVYRERRRFTVGEVNRDICCRNGCADDDHALRLSRCQQEFDTRDA